MKGQASEQITSQNGNEGNFKYFVRLHISMLGGSVGNGDGGKFFPTLRNSDGGKSGDIGQGIRDYSPPLSCLIAILDKTHESNLKMINYILAFHIIVL